MPTRARISANRAARLFYVRSAGLYGSQDGILAALGQSLIGSAAENLLEKVMPHEGQAREAFCNQGIVTNAIQ